MIGQTSHKQRLVVWSNGTPVGIWEASSTENSLTYFDEWITGEQAQPLSLSLPVRPSIQPYQGKVEGELVANYFNNLLPDSDQIRQRIATWFKTDGPAPHDLLSAVGRDCAGAIQLLPSGEAPYDLYEIKGHRLSEGGVAQVLRQAVSTAPLGGESRGQDMRIAIAGAQEKTALLWHQGAWHLPIGSTPSTHILKMPIGLVGNAKADFQTSVENEWLCAKILHAFGLPVPNTEIGHFEDQKALIVERFDRQLSDDGRWIRRLAQEDFCQVAGISPHKKYQNEGGPGISRIMEVLAGSKDAARDRFNFFKAQIVFWLLAAPDGHAKNFSIFHLPGGEFKLTPFYDVLSAHPLLGGGPSQFSPFKIKLAMAVKGTKDYHYRMKDVLRKHWISHADRTGLGQGAAEQMIQELTGNLDSVIDEVSRQIPDGFPLKVADTIFAGLRVQCAKLKIAVS